MFGTYGCFFLCLGALLLSICFRKKLVFFRLGFLGWQIQGWENHRLQLWTSRRCTQKGGEVFCLCVFYFFVCISCFVSVVQRLMCLKGP